MLANLALPFVEWVTGCDEVTEIAWSFGADDADEDSKEEKELKSYSCTPLLELIPLPVVHILRHKPSGFLEKITIEVRYLGTPDLPPERAS